MKHKLHKFLIYLINSTYFLVLSFLLINFSIAQASTHPITDSLDSVFKKHISKTITQQILNGVVLDDNGSPLPGASIIQVNTTNGASTDFDGNFSLVITELPTVIKISFLGFKTQELTIESLSPIKIQMEQDNSSLNEVVITGYSQENRRNVTASIASIKPEEITSIPTSNVTEMLEGRLPGVQILSDNSPGGGTSIRVRGFGTINNNDPLVVVDGVPVSNGLNGINPADIATIQILKDAASSSIYGSRAANGVVIITTKKR